MDEDGDEDEDDGVVETETTRGTPAQGTRHELEAVTKKIRPLTHNNRNRLRNRLTSSTTAPTDHLLPFVATCCHALI